MTRRESIGTFVLMASIFTGGVAVGMATGVHADFTWGVVSLLLCVVAVVILSKAASNG